MLVQLRFMRLIVVLYQAPGPAISAPGCAAQLGTPSCVQRNVAHVTRIDVSTGCDVICEYVVSLYPAVQVVVSIAVD